MSEWLKEHAWKVCIRQRIGGSNPPLTAIISDKSLYESTGFFFYILPNRGDENARPGVDNGQLPVGQMTSLRGSCPQGERSESIPPSPPSFQIRACMKVRAFFFYILPNRGDEPPAPKPALLFIRPQNGLTLPGL
ncbi:Hypothetical protein AKI40_2559 [Enterobacter sp. FY-07]|nr:Hypothetical protein AKI40_2559 [Enterobacter sp. FY-07]